MDEREGVDEAKRLYAQMTWQDLVILRHAFKGDEKSGREPHATFARERLVAIDDEIKRRHQAALKRRGE